MKIYLDDDTAGRHLVGLQRKLKDDVIAPREMGTAGQHDALHLLAAIREQRVLVTRNYRDYDALHKLVVGSNGRHSGILLIRSDNDRSRDMTPADIARAIGKLEKSGIALENQLVVLNNWR